jgi:hypothetical protein
VGPNSQQKVYALVKEGRLGGFVGMGMGCKAWYGVGGVIIW